MLIILVALCWFLMSWLWLLFFFLIGYTFFFFRDPERAVPAEPDVVVAAADGVVVEIVELEETRSRQGNDAAGGDFSFRLRRPHQPRADTMGGSFTAKAARDSASTRATRRLR